MAGANWVTIFSSSEKDAIELLLNHLIDRNVAFRTIGNTGGKAGELQRVEVPSTQRTKAETIVRELTPRLQRRAPAKLPAGRDSSGTTWSLGKTYYGVALVVVALTIYGVVTTLARPIPPPYLRLPEGWSRVDSIPSPPLRASSMVTQQLLDRDLGLFCYIDRVEDAARDKPLAALPLVPWMRKDFGDDLVVRPPVAEKLDGIEYLRAEGTEVASGAIVLGYLLPRRPRLWFWPVSPDLFLCHIPHRHVEAVRPDLEAMIRDHAKSPGL